MEDNKVTVKLVRYEDEVKNEIKKKMRPLIVISLIIGLIIGSGIMYFIKKEQPNQAMSQNDFGNFNEVYQTMTSDWYFSRELEDPNREMTVNAIQGMLLEAGDPHTNYITSENAQGFLEQVAGTYEGIGVSYRLELGQFRILRVFEGSPAEEAGFKVGDIITKVGDVDVTTGEYDNLRDLVTGKKGTEVKITVKRGKETIELVSTRRSISYTVYGEIRQEADKKVGYLEILQFGESTTQEVKQYLDRYKTENVDYLIIDLRNNPGGFLSTVTEIGDLFIDKDKIILQVKNNKDEVEVYKTKKGIQYDYQDLIVLVNENSASASEVLAAALQENNGTTILGKTTYGKGTVQTSKSYKDGGILKYTYAEWLTPSGKPLNKVGVTPNVEVESQFNTIELVKFSKNIEVDSVATEVKSTQQILKILGYSIDRTDGYFSEGTKSALIEYQKDHQLQTDGVINEETLNMIMDSFYRLYDDPKFDTQYIEAVKLLK